MEMEKNVYQALNSNCVVSTYFRYRKTLSLLLIALQISGPCRRQTHGGHTLAREMATQMKTHTFAKTSKIPSTEIMRPAQSVHFLKQYLAILASRMSAFYDCVRGGEGLCIASTCIVLLSGFFGFHIVKKDESGSYRISKLRVFFLFVFLAMSGVSLYITCSVFIGNFDYWMFVMTFPIVSSGLTNIYMYIETGRTARLLTKHMKECERNFLEYKSDSFLMVKILWTLAAHGVYLLWISAWLPADCHGTMMPLVFTSVISCVFDQYIAIFMDQYKNAFEALQERIASVQVWSKDVVKEIAEKYLRVCKALDLHNQVKLSDITNRPHQMLFAKI